MVASPNIESAFWIVGTKINARISTVATKRETSLVPLPEAIVMGFDCDAEQLP